MKRLLFLLSILVAAAPTARAETQLERIATEILADRFGIDAQNILGLRRESREDVWDLGPVYSMSRYGGRNASEVQRLRASGMGWGNIAKKIGMHPGTFNKLRQQGYFDRDPFWDDIFRRRYGVRQDQIDDLRHRGARLEDVLGSIIVAKGSKKPMSEVYGRYRQDKNWSGTANRYKVDLNRWNSYGKKVGWEGAAKPPGKTHGKPITKGKPATKRVSPSKGRNQSKSQGPGKDNQGKGKGKDKGKGG